MKLTLGYSSCPNDTFIFDALVHRKIDTEGLEFDVHMADVEALNDLAFAQKLDITKLSYHTLAWVTEHYILLPAGSALGHNCGPLLIAKHPIPLEQVHQHSIAIPGRFTTANLLLHYTFPQAQQRVPMLFSEIEDAVLQGQTDLGLIIHENRFTYAQRGLHCLLDLGTHWQQHTQLPIPLGGIAARRSLPQPILHRLARVLQRSVTWALEHPDQTMPYVRQHAQSMSTEVIRAHIQLYVNTYTVHLGEQGLAAVHHLLHTARQHGSIPPSPLPIALTTPLHNQ